MSFSCCLKNVFWLLVRVLIVVGFIIMLLLELLVGLVVVVVDKLMLVLVVYFWDMLLRKVLVLVLDFRCVVGFIVMVSRRILFWCLEFKFYFVLRYFFVVVMLNLLGIFEEIR